MENIDSLKLDDQVTVSIWGPEGNCLYKSTNTGFHSLEVAINQAISNANLDTDPENCVFEVTNNTTGVSHRYRLNAHGHLKLIV